MEPVILKENLASAWTFFYKFIFSTIWIAGFGLGTLVRFIRNDNKGPILLVFWLIGVFFIIKTCCMLKDVERSGNNLRISNFFRSVEVPLAEIESVSGSIMMHPELIWLTFYRPTIFGSKIVFMPKTRFLGGWTRHPLVFELQEEIARLRGSRL